jgi:hypothetical protein
VEFGAVSDDGTIVDMAITNSKVVSLLTLNSVDSPGGVMLSL